MSLRRGELPPDVAKATRHVCPLCLRRIAATHVKRHLAAHDRHGADRAVTNAAWLAFLRNRGVSE